MNESTEIVIIEVNDSKFVRKENDGAYKSELGLGHVELVKIEIV